VAKLHVHNFAMSVDGYVAGPDQSRRNPLGVGGSQLHDWAFATKHFQTMLGRGGGDADGIDNDFAARGDDDIGATIMGRNMFGPIRGEWPDEEWKGWWGSSPPYHHPVFVLTHHPRDAIPMEGGTTFNFVTGGIEEALERAFDAAGGHDVRIGGGASTVQQYLKAGLVDDLHIVIVPVLLGRRERLFDKLDDSLDGYGAVQFTSSPAVTHVRLGKKS
jgi:dihydrofolate reductase